MTRVMSHTFLLVSFCRQKICHVTHIPPCVLLQAEDMSCHTHSPLCPFAGRRQDTRHVTHIPPCVLLQAEDKTRVMSHTFPLVSFCWQKIRHASCHTRFPFCRFAGRRQDTRHVTHVPPCVLLLAEDKTRVMSHTFPLVSFFWQKIRHASCHTRFPFCHFAGRRQDTRHVTHVSPSVILQALDVVFVAFTAVWSWTT